MTIKPWTKRQMLRSSVITAIAIAAALPSAAQAQDDEELEELEPVTFTGSRIQSLDVEPIAPILVQTGDDLKNSGYTTVGDALRALPFNSGQALTPTDSGTSFTPGISTINLRGLGNNQSLILINGRRTAPYAAPGFNGFQTMFDLNSIPAAAIDRIEILKDGASAIYGSDAVAGVVNVVLRKDYEGLYTSALFGDFSDTSGSLKQISAVYGTSSAKTSVLVAFNFQQQDAVFARDLDYTKDADKTELAYKASPVYVVENPELSGLGVTTQQEYLDAVGLTDPIMDGWFDNRSSRSYPGWIQADFNGNGSLSSGERRTFENPTNNPTEADAVAGRHFYNYQVENGLFPEYRQMSFYTRASHEVTDTLTAALEVSFSRTESQVESASTPADIHGSHGLTPGSKLTLPSWSQYNPFGLDITTGARRMWENGTRLNDVTSDTPRILGTLAGEFEMGERTMNWEVGVLYSRNDVSNIGRRSAADYKLQQAFYGLIEQPDGQLIWDPTGLQFNSDGSASGWAPGSPEHVYYNWFGENSQEMADFLNIDNPTASKIELQMYDASVSGTLFSLPAGDVGFALGGEVRKEIYEDVQSDLNETGNILGGGEGKSSYGDRKLSAVYTELEIPILENLTLQAAGRYEDYSDKGFASDIRPKIAARFRPLEWLLLKTSFQKSFKAPDLAYLYTTDKVTLSSYQVQDPVTGQQIDQIEQRVRGNADLEPETTDTWYAGVFVEPTGSLEGLRLGVEYLHFDQTNLMAQLSDFYSYGEILTWAADGDPDYVDMVVRDSGTQEVLYILDNFQNISKAEYSGFDFTISYTFETESFGTFDVELLTTWLDYYKIDGGDVAGNYLTPEWRHNLASSWTMGDWAVNVNVNYIDEMERNYYWGQLVGTEDVWVQYTTDPQITVYASVTYSGLWGTDLTVGVNNLFNSDPPMDPLEGIGTTGGVYDPQPQFWWVRVERQF